MGQYYYVVNLDKKQYLHPHRMGDGLKLMEFGSSADGTMMGLAVLLADGNGRGGGDLRSDHPIIGSWAGDRIVIAGDYADDGNHVDPEMITVELIAKAREDRMLEDDEETGDFNLYQIAMYSFEDISAQVREAFVGDYCGDQMRPSIGG